MKHKIKDTIQKLIELERPTKIRIFDTDPDNPERYRSIEDYSVSHTLEGKLINNFTYEIIDYGKLILHKTNKHATRHVILEDAPVDYNFRLTGNKKKRARLLSLYFDHEVFYSDGTQRYRK